MKMTLEYLGLVNPVLARFHGHPASLIGDRASRLVFHECSAWGFPVLGAVVTETADRNVAAIDVTFKTPPAGTWNGAGHDIAAAVTLLDRVVHAPNPVDGELLVNRLAAVQASDLIPALAKSWLRNWMRWLHDDPEPDHRVNNANETMISWVTARIALLDRAFPTILPEALFWPAPRLPKLVE